MAYVKRERLKLAREKLSTEPNLTVTEVATSCGFSHLGRFSIEYASAFGEKPSMTRETAQRNL
jgi:transcriptional regulator GlxA family with amidase domain